MTIAVLNNKFKKHYHWWKEPPGYAFAALEKGFVNTLTMKCFNLIRIAEN